MSDLWHTEYDFADHCAIEDDIFWPMLTKHHQIENPQQTIHTENKKNIKKLEVEPNLFESDMLKLDEEYYSFTDGDILVMISDGVINSKESFGKDWIEEFLRNVSSNNAQKLSDLLMEEVLQNYYDIPQDDITIIVAKIVKK